MRREVIRLGREVEAALADGRPVVALESSVVAQGLPPPTNLESAHACEDAVRAEGAVPAITAFLAGRPVAGLTHQELDELVDPRHQTRKVGARDAAAVLSMGYWGATTVSATCAIADAVGIPIFSTGGIGGVHREADQTFDISQDLLAIARYRVAVITAGAKAILDLPRTLEALESMGVPVVGYRTLELPAFYTNHSGLRLEHQVDGPAQAAALLHARWDEVGAGGVVIANPVPEEAQADPTTVGLAIEDALREASDRGVRGKALTPFLLAEVARLSGGESLKANVALLVQNAKVAAQIASALAQLRRGKRSG
jgi:pseudouridylate synthase